MKKKELAKLAAFGITAGLMATACEKQPSPGTPPPSPPSNNKAAAAEEQMSSDVQSFYTSLSPDAQKKFMELDMQHRMMAIETARQECNGKNKCKSMGGCSTMNHSCSGKNACKGQGGAPIRDPNKAVEIQYKNQKEQRQRMEGGNQNPNFRQQQPQTQQQRSGSNY